MTRTGFVALIGLVLSACQALPVATSANAVPEAIANVPARVLFVGNSFTYYNDSLHNHLRRLMASAPADAGIPEQSRMRIMTISGSHLAEHTGLAHLAKAEPWDVIVLQGHSLEAFEPDRLEGFHRAVDRHVTTIRDAGARPLLFMTWAYLGRPEMIDTISHNYRQAGQRNGVEVVPVGLAFDRARRELPGVTLIHPDQRHPTVAGTYLAACMFLGNFYPGAAADLDYTAGLDRETARALQQVAWSTLGLAATP